MSAMSPSNVDISNITFSTLKTLDNGGKMIFMNYNGGMFHLETPELEIPFDARYFGDNGDNSMDSKSGKYPVKVQLKNTI